MLRTRFAPSPTGALHLGGARTALYNYLFAKNHDGEFLLRIEDTDIERSKKEYVDDILSALKGLGLNWDGKVIYQSERFDIYKKYANELVENDFAYSEDGAIKFRVPENTEIEFNDILHGKIKFSTKEIQDFVIIKNDGSPTYNFSVAVDDHDMQITHVIRGDDHITNTPKQVLIYKAFEWNIPGFAHIPMITGEDGQRLSKRHGATAVTEYFKEGFIGQGLVNYLALLGWGFDGKTEVFTLDELIDFFDLKVVNKTPSKFDLTKLSWINYIHFDRLKSEDKYFYVKSYLPENIRDEKNKIIEILNISGNRLKNPQNFFKEYDYFFNDKDKYEIDSKKKIFEDKNKIIEILKESAKILNKDNDFTIKTLENDIDEIVTHTQSKLGDVIAVLRMAVAYSLVSPGIYETLNVLGKEKTMKRIDKITDFYKKNEG
ncbi:MAG: glutamate--tRNA ligase [Candidatus Muiribacteriota bacterium]